MRRAAAIFALLVILTVTAGAALACPLEAKSCCPREQARTECVLDCPYLAAADRTTPATVEGAAEAPPAITLGQPAPVFTPLAGPVFAPDLHEAYLRIRVLRI